ncbi:hypothetical protein DL764_002931 [Monosporascus ibericus]|uniref:ER membrane protein complex subunit 10 n=1 Tax=Monosporascus ibericus TaxID=155417 RepID=A0A4V1XBN0_9PEZI|nr:hypothetical protein DL764_002931 [Monosporascus ibericus]
MRPSTIFSGLAALALASVASSAASSRTATIYVQPISPGSAAAPVPPMPLATIRYKTDSSSSFTPSSTGAGSDADADADAEAEDADAEVRILSYEAPELPADVRLLRVGVYDPSRGAWASGTTLAGAENLARGYAPTLLLSVEGKGDEAVVTSAALRGVAVDAGHTRDFGPKAALLRPAPGRQVDLDKPVVPKAAGQGEPEPEKSLLQKYWWLIAVVLLLTMSGGGEGGK